MARTAETPTFESILDMPATDVERPKPIPVGTYNAIVQGLYETGRSSEKKTEFVQFAFAIQSAEEDVDEEDLVAALTAKDGTVKALGSVVIKNNSTKFYTANADGSPSAALSRLTDFFTHCDIDQEGKSLRQCLSETPNCSVKILIGHVASKDGESIFAEVKKIMPAD
jgi:hypothetical protein